MLRTEFGAVLAVIGVVIAIIASRCIPQTGGGAGAKKGLAALCCSFGVKNVGRIMAASF